MSNMPTYEELAKRVKELEKVTAECELVEQERKESEARYRLLTENMMDIVWTRDKDFNLTYISPSLERLSGFTAEEMINRPASDYFTIPSNEVLQKATKKYIESFLESSNDPGPLTLDLEDIRKDGSTGWSEVNIHLIRGSEGDFAGIVGVSRDITARKLAEKELKRCRHHLEELVAERTSELSKINEELQREIIERKKGEEALCRRDEEYRLLAENIIDVIWTTDLSFRFSYISPSIEALRGYSAKEVMGQPFDQILTAESSKKVAEIADRERIHIDNGTFQPRTLELELVHKNGSTVWTESTISALYDKAGSPLCILGVTRDITERKQAEKNNTKLEEQLLKSKKMEALGTLAGGVAHDFNNILAAIIGSTELLLLPNEYNSTCRSDLEQILQSANRGKDLVKQILTYTRMTEQKREPIDITKILAEMYKLFRASLPATIKIEQNIHDNSGCILGDSTQIFQVLMNLCSNAAFAMRERGGLLKINLKKVALHAKDIALYPELKKGAYFKLTVSDTGLGIDPADIDRIFDPFFTTKGVGDGTGMGLSVVQGIIQNHNGAVRVRSQPGKGTAFDLFFPIIDKAPVAVTDILKPRTKIIKKAKDTSILFVDDQNILVETGKQMLEHLGYKVVALTNSVEALDVFSKNPSEFNLVITDMTMPEMTGVELSKEMLRIRPDLPIILCTGFNELLNEEKAKKIGIREMLMKPLSADELTDTIDQVLAQK